MTDCLCGHDPHNGQCPVTICGCKGYRPRAPVSDEAERWLAGREGGQDAAREGVA